VTALALALALALSTAPLECPPGTEHRGLGPPEGFEEWCEGKDDAGRPRREGPARRYYDDGDLFIEEHYRGGERDGAFVERYRGGAKAREGSYTRGAKTGLWTVWSALGAREEEAEFKDGVPHGRFTAFWPTGAKKTEGRRCGGAQCGSWRSWDDRGHLVGSGDYAESSLTP
jgi:antitoxin component YwqK of YwqJK toxin-antitoxin module